MPAISTTTLEALEPRMVALIEAIAPRIQTQQSSAWKHYRRGKTSPGRTRSFTLRWEPGGLRKPIGYFTSNDKEYTAELRVRTDYSGQHETLMWLVQDDYVALSDTINKLTADTTTGLVKVLPGPGKPTQVADTGQGRQALSGSPAFNSDSIQIDHVFAVTFMQAHIAA